MKNILEEDFNRYGYHWADPTLYPRLKEFSARMRAFPTHAEDLLWNALRGKKLNGHKFRRQHIVSRYIADFICLRAQMIIEIDGLIHQLPENQQSDAERQHALEELGFCVIRFTNEEVINSLEKVISQIANRLDSQTTIELL